MSAYRSFAIVGVGEVGSWVLDSFIKSEAEHLGSGYKLRALTRSKDRPELVAYASKGVDVIAVDYSSLQSLTHALAGVDVVIFTLREGGLELQNNVLRAAKAAGAKLLVPGEYGRNTFGDTSEYLKEKPKTHELLNELALPYTLFFTGVWPELIFPSSFGHPLAIDLEGGKFALFGDGNADILDVTPLIRPLVHHILTTLPTAELENRVINIEGDRKTFGEIIAVWEAKHGTRAQVTVRSEAEIKEFHQQDAVGLKFLAKAFGDGSCLVSGDDNVLWPE